MRFLVFDVESIGLHGEGFAVGWVVHEDGKEVSQGRLACPPASASGDDLGRSWVMANVPTLEFSHQTPRDVRTAFWQVWLEERSRGTVLVSDCGWPVEARFLAACVDDDPVSRCWDGPYPLHDLATLRLACGLAPLGGEDRLPAELPVHDPLADARQSARLWSKALLAGGNTSTAFSPKQK